MSYSDAADAIDTADAIDAADAAEASKTTLRDELVFAGEYG